MQTTYTASAGDKVSFFWKVSSESSADHLKFYIDDQLQNGEELGSSLNGASEAGRVVDRCVRSVKPPIET